MIDKNIYFLLLIFYFSSCTTKPMEIESFSNADVNEITEHGYNYVAEKYLVKNWTNTVENETKIDSFVCAKLREDFENIHSYFISFYKYSETVNQHYYRMSKKLCELDMLDACILSYEFREGRLSKIKRKPTYKQVTNFNCKKVKYIND